MIYLISSKEEDPAYDQLEIPISRIDIDLFMKKELDIDTVEKCLFIFDDIENFDENTEIQLKRRIIGGFVYLEVPGFKTPIVRLWLTGAWTSEQDVEKIATHIKQERKLLPINSFFEAL